MIGAVDLGTRKVRSALDCPHQQIFYCVYTSQCFCKAQKTQVTIRLEPLFIIVMFCSKLIISVLYFRSTCPRSYLKSKYNLKKKELTCGNVIYNWST